MKYICSHCQTFLSTWSGQCSKCKRRGSVDIYYPEPVPVGRSRQKIASSVDAFDYIVGGALCAGQAIVLGGAPGVGKSTLIAQILAGVHKPGRRPIAYFTAEETQDQIVDRFKRLELRRPYIINDDRLHLCIEWCHIHWPSVIVFDSLQRFRDENLKARAGTPSQIKSVAHHIIALAKRYQSIVLAISQVNRSDDFSGGRGVEHDFDTVVHFDIEGARDSVERVLHTSKNRYGASHLSQYMTMTEKGLVSAEVIEHEK